MIGDQQAGAILRQVLNAADLNPEPILEKEAQQRQDERVVELRIESEFVDRVIAGEPLGHEISDRRNALRQFIRSLGGPTNCACSAPRVDFPDDSGNFFSRCPGAGVGQQ